ncbi:uncharacterized protein LOC116024469 [Ipomoea triloba]|uniref:uncharacterized protein LOC116024469 n=1 Tax=Ipomoea triloba TaxID=35885 RepID=UPI00125D0B52|nr:uncharacterized protein LOC116024469 [Ipomoea triloba]
MVFPLWFGLHDFLGGSLLNVIERFIQNVDTFKAVEMAARLWVIWSARNDRLWNDKVWSLEDLRRAVESFLHDWKLAYSPSENISQVHSVASHAVWHPPPEGWVKCNVDVSLRESSMGYGAVLRNHQGQFVAALSGRLFCDRDPYLAESIAVKEALTWLKDRGTENVILETDCLNFCNNFNSARRDFSYVGLIIKQCRVIARDIGITLVRHVNRSANQVAHELARATGSFSVLGVWDSTPPTCISVFFDN